MIFRTEPTHLGKRQSTTRQEGFFSFLKAVIGKKLYWSICDQEISSPALKLFP